MIDNFSLLLSHGLLLLTVWRLLSRPDLDDDNASREKPRPDFRKRKAARRA